MNEIASTLSNKFDIDLPVYPNFDLKTLSFRKNSIKRIICKKIHFVVYCMQFALNSVGLNIDFPPMDYNYRNPRIVFKLSYYIWNLITTVQIITFLSLVFTIPAHGSLKIFISHAFQRALSLTNRLFLYMNKNKCQEILLEINTLKCLKTVRCKRVKYMLIITALYIHVYAILCVYALLKSLTAEEIEIRNARNVFNIRFDQYSAEIILSVVTSVWIYAYVVIPSIFAITYAIFSNIMRNEFYQLMYEVNNCYSEPDGRLIIEKYDRAIEIGQAFDDALNLPVFSVLGYILISLFFNGYRLFVNNMINTYEVSVMLLPYDNTFFMFSTLSNNVEK